MSLVSRVFAKRLSAQLQKEALDPRWQPGIVTRNLMNPMHRQHFVVPFAFSVALSTTAGLSFANPSSAASTDRVIALRYLQQAAQTPVQPTTQPTQTLQTAQTPQQPTTATATRPDTAIINNVQKSLFRADQARAAGDTKNAAYLEGLAREWAELGADLTRTIAVESAATKKQNAASSASTKIRKTEAMLDSLAAQRARTEAELQQVRASSNAALPEAAISAARLRQQQQSKNASQSARSPSKSSTPPASQPGSKQQPNPASKKDKQ